MNWPFEITFPVHEEFDWILDANGRLIMAQHLAEGANALHAEVERLREKISDFSAVFDKWWEHYTAQETKQEGWGWIDEAWGKLKSAAAIKEAEK